MKIKVLNTETQIEVREMSLNDWIDQSGECSLGRSPYSGLVLDSPDVSRLHAKFAFESGHYYFYDLGSSNGSMINGRIVDPQQKQLLNPGDIIRVGEFMLTIYPVDEQSEMPATVIGGAEMTVCVQPPMPKADEPLESAKSQSEAQPELRLEQPKIEEILPQKEPLLNASLEMASLTDLLNDQSSEHSFDNSLSSESNDLLAKQQLADLNAEGAFSRTLESDFTVIQLESTVDSSELAIETTEQIIECFEEDSDRSDSDRSSVEEPTFIQSEVPESEAEFSEPGNNFNAEAVEETNQFLHLSIEAAGVVEVVPGKTDLFPYNAQPLDAVSPESAAQLSAEFNQSTEADENPELSPLQSNQPDQDETEPKVELDSAAEFTLEVTLDGALDDDCQSEENDVKIEAEAHDLVKLEGGKEANTSDVTDTSSSDTQIPTSVEHQPVLSEKYVALLAHDSQAAALAELVANHKAYLSHYLTITTPSISETLKQQADFTVTEQTPAVPVGGYQTINSLITANKVAAVIFLRDFLSAQVNQANDEAFSRSCNIHQVLFASNFPTAVALIHHLHQAVTRQ